MAKKPAEEVKYETIPYLKVTSGTGRGKKTGGYAMRGASIEDIAKEIAEHKSEGRSAEVEFRQARLQPGEKRAGDNARGVGETPEAKKTRAAHAKYKASEEKAAAAAAKKAAATPAPPRTERKDGKPYSSASARGVAAAKANGTAPAGRRSKNNPTGAPKPPAAPKAPAKKAQPKTRTLVSASMIYTPEKRKGK